MPRIYNPLIYNDSTPLDFKKVRKSGEIVTAAASFGTTPAATNIEVVSKILLLTIEEVERK